MVVSVLTTSWATSVVKSTAWLTADCAFDAHDAHEETGWEERRELRREARREVRVTDDLDLRERRDAGEAGIVCDADVLLLDVITVLKTKKTFIALCEILYLLHNGT